MRTKITDVGDCRDRKIKMREQVGGKWSKKGRRKRREEKGIEGQRMFCFI